MSEATDEIQKLQLAYEAAYGTPPAITMKNNQKWLKKKIEEKVQGDVAESRGEVDRGDLPKELQFLTKYLKNHDNGVYKYNGVEVIKEGKVIRLKKN